MVQNRLLKFIYIAAIGVVLYVVFGCIFIWANEEDIPRNYSVSSEIDIDSYLVAKLSLNDEVETEVHSFSCPSNIVWVLSNENVVKTIVSSNWNSNEVKLLDEASTCLSSLSIFQQLQYLPIYLLIKIMGSSNKNKQGFLKSNIGEKFDTKLFDDPVKKISYENRDINIYELSCFLGCTALAVHVRGDKVVKMNTIPGIESYARIKEQFESSEDQLNDILKFVKEHTSN